MWSKKVQNFADDMMHISGQQISTKRGLLSQSDLQYWENNPRIYSIVHASDSPLDQDDIQIELQAREHVKDLIKDIRYHGGLIDPIVVIDKSFEVIEGNSRLAALRFLSQKDPVKFSRQPCVVLPKSISDELVYSYLNQEHIQGKTQWSPYEQAGVIYRLMKGGMSRVSLQKEMNISKRKAQQMYDVYAFMVEHKEDRPDSYSYYQVYLTNQKARSKRKVEPNMDDRIVAEIKNGNATAQEFRKMLPLVCDNPKQFNKFISGKHSLSGAYDILEDQGKSETLVVRLRKIHSQVQDMRKKEFDDLNVKAQKDCEYRVKRIITTLQNLQKRVFGN